MRFLYRFKRFFKLRFAIVYPLALYLVLFTQPTDDSILAGAGFLVAGMLMRVWSNGYAIKMGKLTTSGPYAFVRNPLYVGTGLIVLGFAVMLQVLLWGLAFFAVIVFVYYRTIKDEEQMLEHKFGKAYVDYKKSVPAMWPTLHPYQAGEKWPFSWQRLWDSREHKIVLWMPVIVIGFHLKDELLIEHEVFDQRMGWLIMAVVVLGLLDVLSEIVRYGLSHAEKESDQ